MREIIGISRAKVTVSPRYVHICCNFHIFLDFEGSFVW